jgi:broad specificity phosphatase PhoE
MPSGESLDDVHRRALTMVNQVVEKHDGAVALASHRVVNKVLICALLGLDNSHFWDIRLDTCGMTTFEFTDGRFVLVEHNNTSFLEPLKQERLGDF